MNFPRFWAKETAAGPPSKPGSSNFECWGWSNISLAEAQKLAREKAARVAEHFFATRQPPDRYAYGTRPLREEVLRTITDSGGETTAVLSRNQYGCIILNTARVMFVDIDIPELDSPSKPRFSAFWKPEASPEDDFIQPHVNRVENWTASRPDWSWRIYRTRAGLRLLATHALFHPAQAEPVFTELKADPLYQKLCVNQETFRARLTPKPWRIGHAQPSVSWPWMDPKQEASFAKWEQLYLSKANDYATCCYLKTIGNGVAHPEIVPLIHLHDEATRAETNLPLA